MMTSQVFLLFLLASVPKVWSQSNDSNNKSSWKVHRIIKKDTMGGRSSSSSLRRESSHNVELTTIVPATGRDYTSGYYDDSSVQGGGYSPHYYYNKQNGGNGGGAAAAFNYRIYPATSSSTSPAVSNSYSPYYYGPSPGYFQGYYRNYGNGWNNRATNFGGGGGGGGGGKGNQIDWSNLFNWDEIMDNMVYGPMAQTMGLKGGDGASIVKFGFVFLAIAIPLLLVITIPLSVLIVFLILIIPFPVWNQNGFFKSLKDSTGFLTRSIIQSSSDSECVERISCQIDQFSKKYGKESWLNRAKTSFSTLLNSSTNGTNNAILQRKISRGFSQPLDSSKLTSSSSCARFSCNFDPVGYLKKALKVYNS